MQRPNPSRMHDDPPKDPTIAHWFEVIGPPPPGAAPPHLQAKVRARLAQRQAQWGLGAWLPQLRLPTWGLALTASLVLLLGLNVWWGLHTWGPQAPGTRQEAGVAIQRLHIAQFQRQIQHTHALGTFVAAHSVLREPAAIVAFTPQPTRTAFVRLGTLYAEALATLASGEVEATAQRLDGLSQTLAQAQAPPALAKYLRTVHTLLQGQQSSSEEVATVLALFEPLYDDAYAGDNTMESIRLFRAGAWLENLSLAAAARDAVALRHGEAAFEEVRSTLTRVNAPPEVLAAHTRIQRLLTQPTLAEDELRTIQTLVYDIQERLRD